MRLCRHPTRPRERWAPGRRSSGGSDRWHCDGRGSGPAHRHGGDAHHSAFELARNPCSAGPRGSTRHSRGSRDARRGGPSCGRRCPRLRSVRRGPRRRAAGCAGRSTRNPRDRDRGLIHHQHGALELGSGGALQIEGAFRAGLRRVRVLRSTIRTEHALYLPKLLRGGSIAARDPLPKRISGALAKLDTRARSPIVFAPLSRGFWRVAEDCPQCPLH